MSAIKKQGPAFYADAVAVILGIAGTIVMSVCHTMDTANPLNSFGKLIAFAVVVGWLLLGEKISWMSILGAVLITLGVIFANKDGSQS